MSWATEHIKKLKAGEPATFRPRGCSMAGRVEDGELVTVLPLSPSDVLRVGDVVLCKVRGRQYLHLIKATRGKNPPRYQIGNNRGGINGWVGRSAIFGRLAPKGVPE